MTTNEPRPTPAPAPPRASRWRQAGIALGLALLGAASGAAGVHLARRNFGFDPDAVQLGAIDLALVPLWAFAVILVHELGHVAGGRAAGMRFLLLLVGPLKVWRAPGGLRAGFNRALATWGGMAACAPRTIEDFRPRMMRVVLGGPLASLVLALVALLATLPLDGRAAVHAAAIGALSLVIGLVTLVPASAGGFDSDGAQWLALRRGGTAVEQRGLVVALYGATLAGVRPRDLDAALIGRALGLPGSPRNALALQLFALSRALDRDDPVAARTHAEAVAAGIDAFPDGFRQGLALELAWFEARHGSAQAAQAWLARARGGVVEASQRARAEAGVALARGDAAAAIRHADAALAALPKSMDAGMAVAAHEWLQALRAEARTLLDDADFIRAA